MYVPIPIRTFRLKGDVWPTVVSVTYSLYNVEVVWTIVHAFFFIEIDDNHVS
jgi:hypothetical protein